MVSRHPRLDRLGWLGGFGMVLAKVRCIAKGTLVRSDDVHMHGAMEDIQLMGQIVS